MARFSHTTIFTILYHVWLLHQCPPALSSDNSEHFDENNNNYDAEVDNNWNTKDFQKREHCLTKPYHHGGAGGRPLWDFGGSAMITSNYVRLTADKQGSKGNKWRMNDRVCNMQMRTLLLP